MSDPKKHYRPTGLFCNILKVPLELKFLIKIHAEVLLNMSVLHSMAWHQYSNLLTLCQMASEEHHRGLLQVKSHLVLMSPQIKHLACTTVPELNLPPWASFDQQEPVIHIGHNKTPTGQPQSQSQNPPPTKEDPHTLPWGQPLVSSLLHGCPHRATHLKD